MVACFFIMVLNIFYVFFGLYIMASMNYLCRILHILIFFLLIPKDFLQVNVLRLFCYINYKNFPSLNMLVFYNLDLKCILESDLPTFYYLYIRFSLILRLWNHSKYFILIHLEVFLFKWKYPVHLGNALVWGLEKEICFKMINVYQVSVIPFTEYMRINYVLNCNIHT